MGHALASGPTPVRPAHRRRRSSEPFPGLLRAIEREDLHPLARFIDAEARAIGHRGQSPAYYGWRYLEPLAARCSQVAVDDGRVVGFVGCLPVRMQIEGRQHLVAEVSDCFVSRGYRRFGTYGAMLGRVARELSSLGVPFVFGRPNESSVIGPLEAGGRLMSALRTHVRPLTPGYVVDKLGSGAWGPAVLALKLSLLPSRVLRGGMAVRPLHRFGRTMDRLGRRAAQQHGTMLVRDARFMSWRYLRCPLPYVIRGAFWRGRLVGVAVGSCRGENAEIVDLITVPEGGRRLAYVLIGALLEEMTARGCSAVRCSPPESMRREDDVLLEALALHGFVPTEERQALALMPVANASLMHSFAERGHWTFRGGDTDWS